jgi:hypothetical protein
MMINWIFENVQNICVFNTKVWGSNGLMGLLMYNLISFHFQQTKFYIEHVFFSLIQLKNLSTTEGQCILHNSIVFHLTFL